MHSVDYLAVIKAPATQHMVASYAICADGNNTASTGSAYEWVTPPPVYPFSRLSSVNISYNAPPRANLSPPTGGSVLWDGTGPNFRVLQTATVGPSSNPATSRFSIEA